MVCETIRKNMECPFMTAKGCTYNGGSCQKIVEQCEGCSRLVKYSSDFFCIACPDPSLKWKEGKCNLASHVAMATSAVQKKLNPLKASKRKSAQRIIIQPVLSLLKIPSVAELLSGGESILYGFTLFPRFVLRCEYSQVRLMQLYNYFLKFQSDADNVTKTQHVVSKSLLSSILKYL